MTSTVSFKEKFKQALALFKWDLKACTGTLTVYGILATVFTTIVLTLCLVVGNGINDMVYGMSHVSSSYSQDVFGKSIQAFQYISTGILYLMTTVFTIFYTIKVFSYLHNKRKADMYGSLPIGRTTLYLTKAVSAYVFSVVPTLFFMGIISLISICCGQPLVNEVTELYTKIIIGALACISAYGLIAVCCGTTFNTVVMFIVVCIAYPLSAMFIKGTISGFFIGLYTGVFKDHFIMNALNPLAAYDGINIIYWIIFSIVCIAAASFLVKKRKAERAQSSFAYYLPCHIIKVLVAFLTGMFLGVLFGSLNVFGYGYLGFIFGFILGSVPAFIIAHLIFYKGFSNLIKTSIPLGGLIVVILAGMAVCNFDLIGYNSFLPDAEDIKSAGLFDSAYTYVNKGENFKKLLKGMADDFDEEEMKNEIINLHEKVIRNFELDSKEKFTNVWEHMLLDNMPIAAMTPEYGFSYRMPSGRVVTRIYTEDTLNIRSYSDNPVSLDTSKIVQSKKYVEKYSGMVKAETDEVKSMTVLANTKDNVDAYCNIVDDKYNYMESTKPSKENYDDCEKIREAFRKDLAENAADFDKDMLARESFYSMQHYIEENPDIVCQISIRATSAEPLDFSDIFSNGNATTVYSSVDESYLIPKSFTNTISALQEIGLFDKDLKLNTKSKYFSNDLITDLY